MKILLELPDHKAADFIAVIKSLGYVNLSQGRDIPESQKHETIKRLQMLESGTMKKSSWEAFEKDITLSLGLPGFHIRSCPTGYSGGNDLV